VQAEREKKLVVEKAEKDEKAANAAIEKAALADKMKAEANSAKVDAMRKLTAAEETSKRQMEIAYKAIPA